MKKWLVLALALAPIFGFSQKKWFVEAAIGGGLANATLRSEQSRRELSGANESRAGVFFGKDFAKKSWFRAGLFFHQANFLEHQTGIRWPSEHDGMGGWTPDPNLPHELDFVQKERQLELPFRVGWHFGLKRLKPTVELGIFVSALTATNMTQKGEPQSDWSKSGGKIYKSVSRGGLTAAFGFEKTINKRLFWRTQVYTRLDRGLRLGQFDNVFDEFDPDFLSLGLETSLGFRF